MALLGIGELPAAEPEIRIPPALRLSMPGSTAKTRSCTPSTLSCTWAFSAAGSSFATGPNVAVPAFAHSIEMSRWPSSVASRSRCSGRQVNGPHFDRHAVALLDTAGDLVENLLAPRGDDQVVSAGGQFGGQRLADALGGTGDDGPTVGRGRGVACRPS